MQNPKAKLNRKAIHWHYPHYHHDRPAVPFANGLEINRIPGRNRRYRIISISQDLSESNNLADERKGKVADLKKKLSDWRNEVLARIPVPNPSYNPGRALNGGIVVQANQLTVLPAKDFRQQKRICRADISWEAVSN
ncbi:MAG: hypothetical protein CM15mP130_2330 [Verrucomicrobiota bacterium]|nr:MAG: hypothetical protein CM15mP130_2330 [Verrucomicrobiota bacterium]